MLDIIILAAGKGTRMKSDKPKVLHTVAGKPLLQHVIDRARELQANKIYVVVGHGAEEVKQTIGDAEDVVFVEQREQMGTGHAVQQVLPFINSDTNSLILYGDVPLISTSTLERLLQLVTPTSVGLLTVNMPDPTGYGRILKDPQGQVTAIVEHKDATTEQKNIREINSGIMALPGKVLLEWLPQLSNENAQGEYYLTDLIAMAASQNVAVNTAQPLRVSETLGINNRQQQAEVERLLQQELVETYMNEGLTVMDPQRFDCRGSLTFDTDCVIDVNCVFEGDVVLGKNVEIGPNCHIINARIGDNSIVKSHSIIEDAEVKQAVVIGPFARIRPQTILEDNAKVGNFVEIKKARIGQGSKVNHLSYVGDAELGRDVNVGAGTITCNYDGVNKHLTKIGDKVFVGSNTALVAPVTIEDNVTIAAGSTITHDIDSGSLSVARSRQKNITGWQRPSKKK